MKILQVVPTYLPAVRHGGPIRAVHGLAKSLVALGHEVVAATTHLDGDGVLDVPLGEPVDLDGVEVRYFAVDRPRRLARSRAMGRWLMREAGGFDVVHLHALFLWPTSVGAHAARRAARPWVVSPRGMLVRDLFRRRGWLRKRLWLALSGRRVLEGASRLVVTSEIERTEALRFGLDLPPIELLPNGVEPLTVPLSPEGLDPALVEFVSGAPVFLYLGRLSWKKGIDLLLDALALRPRARLVVAGNDDERIGEALDERARQLGIAERVQRSGFVDGTAKAWLLANARALVLPSISENFANVVLEAWSVGTPVVVSEGVGLSPEVREARAGRVVERSAAAVAEALALFEAEPSEAQAMGERGRALCAGRFSWSAVGLRAEELYAAALRERTAVGAGGGR